MSGSWEPITARGHTNEEMRRTLTQGEPDIRCSLCKAKVGPSDTDYCVNPGCQIINELTDPPGKGKR